MAKKKPGGGVPVGLLVAGVHALVDLATNATCPKCHSQVVIYFCTGCKTAV